MELTYCALPLSEKLQIAALVTEYMIKVESIKFGKPGRLIGKRNLLSVSYPPPTPSTDIEITGYRETPT